MVPVPGKTRNPNRFLLILAALLLLSLFIVNAYIRKSIDGTGEILFLGSPAENISSALRATSATEESLPAMQTMKEDPVNSSAKSSKNPQPQDKEIFYEPSIKGDILLQ